MPSATARSGLSSKCRPVSPQRSSVFFCEQTGGKPRSKRLVDMRSRDFDAARGDCYGCIAPPPHPTVHADQPIELRQELVRNIFPAHKHCHDFLNRAVALATTG